MLNSHMGKSENLARRIHQISEWIEWDCIVLAQLQPDYEQSVEACLLAGTIQAFEHTKNQLNRQLEWHRSIIARLRSLLATMSA